MGGIGRDRGWEEPSTETDANRLMHRSLILHGVLVSLGPIFFIAPLAKERGSSGLPGKAGWTIRYTALMNRTSGDVWSIPNLPPESKCGFATLSHQLEICRVCSQPGHLGRSSLEEEAR